jgi:phage shock protein A
MDQAAVQAKEAQIAQMQLQVQQQWDSLIKDHAAAITKTQQQLDELTPKIQELQLQIRDNPTYEWLQESLESKQKQSELLFAQLLELSKMYISICKDANRKP